MDQAHVHALKLQPSCHLRLLYTLPTLPPCCHAVVLDSSKVLLSPSRVPAGKPRGLCPVGTGDKRTEGRGQKNAAVEIVVDCSGRSEVLCGNKKSGPPVPVQSSVLLCALLL